MSWTPNLCKFNPKRWGYIGLIVEDFIKQSWKKERAIKPPAGVLIELRNFVESALKGFGTLPLGPKDIEIEIEDFIHNVMLIVQRTSSHLSYNDKTLVMIKEYQALFPEKVKLYQSQPKGISNAMNIGIDVASGEYIHFLHSDDWYYDSNTLSYINGLIESTQKQILIGPETLQYGNILFNSRILKHFTNKQIIFLLKIANLIPHASLFMTKDLFDQYGKFDESIKIGMDYDLWFRVLKEDSFLIYDKPTVVYRRHSDATSFKLGNLYKMLKEDVKIKRRYNKPTVSS